MKPSSFLLHRPCIRLNELPLFDTLFTGVQPGEAGRSASGGGALSSSAYDPSVAAAKSRLWILRALRDGKNRKEQARFDGMRWYMVEQDGDISDKEM